MAGDHVAHNSQRGVPMVKVWRRVVLWVLALGLSACGGGSVEFYWGPSPSGWVTIDPVPSTVCDSATLSGAEMPLVAASERGRAQTVVLVAAGL